MRFVRWLTFAFASFGSLAGASAQSGDERDVKSFSLPATQSARALYERSVGHVDAQRWSDAISGLQELLELHRGAVLGAERRDSLGRRSQQDVHTGVTRRVLALLSSLAPEARKTYRERFGASAAAELERARHGGDAQGLVELARRWPITLEAEHAWLALGDLEFERGNGESAKLAWLRAEALAKELGDELPLGATRIALLDPSQDPSRDPSASASRALSTPASGSLRLDDGAQPSGPLPGPECHVWRRKLSEDDPTISTSLRWTQAAPVMTPVLVGDRLLVATPLRLIAYNAYSGHREWRSEELGSWKDVDAGRVRVADTDRVLQRGEFFQGVNGQALMLAPTAWGNVAVAALQIPYSNLGNWKYQNIQVTTITPERRLFAFDLTTGEPLWSHLPPPLWDGESGAFPERMRVAGPPVAWQGRLYAPFYRMQGRVEFHVGCFDLYSGKLLWSTALISGQVELNMFGRQNRELATPPLLIHRDRVVAQTQLGTLAALDAFTGDIAWETLYDQLPLPPAQGYSSGERDEFWLPSPAVVADGVVVATPLDCADLIGIDLEHGTLLWSKPHSRMSTRNLAKLALLGADERSVVLGSAAQVIQIAANAGLATPQGPTEQSGSDRALGEAFLGPENQPRPLLVGDRVVVPSSSRRWVLPRANLRTPDSQLSAAWPSDAPPGNLASGPGVLYSLSSNAGGSTLIGLCDWNSLEERLQRDFDRAPNDLDMACAWADFLASRAELEQRDGRTAKALSYFARLRAALEPLLDAEAPTARPQIAMRLHAALLGEARALTDLADVRGAIERLDRSRTLAVDAEEQRDTLWALARLAAHRDRVRYRALLGELDAVAADLELPDDDFGATGSGVAAGAKPADDDPAARRGFGGRIQVGLWVQIELAALARTEGSVAGELEALHSLLERYGDVLVAEGEPASERIGTLVGLNPPSEYAPFEERARTLLEEASANGDLELLTRIRDLYPHSRAAMAAVEAALAIARTQERLDLFASELAGSLAAHWSFARANTAELTRLADFASLALQVGERELATAVFGRLATIVPDLPVERAPGEPSVASEVAKGLLGEPPIAAADQVTFDDTLRPRGARSNGAWDLLGYLPLAPGAAPDAPRHVVTSTRGWIEIWRGGASPERPELIVRQRVDEQTDPEIKPNRVVLGSDRVVIGLADEIVAIDVTEPSSAWRGSRGGQTLEALVGGDGVVVAAFVDRARRVTLVAFSIELGAELWEREVGLDVSLPPLFGDGRVVLLPRGRGLRSAQVLDLFTGSQSASFELDADAWENDGRAAWIERGKVILPAFRRNARSTSEMLRAFDLESGAKSWSVPSETGRELETVLRAGGRTYLVLAAEAIGGRVQNGAILELDTSLGALRPLQNAKLAPGDLLVGVPRLAVVELDTPFVFVRSEATGVRETMLRAIHLPYGERWATRLSVPVDALYNGAMPRPVVSQSTVALVYGEWTRNRDGERDRRTSLALFDRASGQRRDLRTLDPSLGGSEYLEILGLGSALFVAGSGGMDVLSK